MQRLMQLLRASRDVIDSPCLHWSPGRRRSSPPCVLLMLCCLLPALASGAEDATPELTPLNPNSLAWREQVARGERPASGYVPLPVRFFLPRERAEISILNGPPPSSYSLKALTVAPSPGGPAAPTNISASDGIYSDKVRVTWDAVAGATDCEVWRGKSSSVSSAVRIRDNATSPYDDTTASPGTTYYYRVKARNTYGPSGFSAPDAGYRVPTYTLTVNAVNGTVTREPAKSAYTPGEVVKLTASPDSGYVFTGWSGDLSGTTNPATIVMDADKTVTATLTRSDEPVQFADPNLKAAVEQALVITDPTPADMLRLTLLFAREKGIIDLDGIQYAMNLTYLDLSMNRISDIGLIARLTNLTTLSLFGNQISDVTPVGELMKLTHLDLKYNQISDITPVAGLTKLMRIDLGNNRISNITPVAGLTSLKYLSLYNNQIADITPVAGLTNLTTLYLYSNQISDITPVVGLTNLTTFYVQSNQISDITPVAGLTNLTSLSLCYNLISDITPVVGLTNLTTLYLQSNQISDITPVAGLTNLTVLSLFSNQISDITPVAGLTNLADLQLYSNRISDITPVAGSINLKELSLANNQISDITPVAGLTSLKYLYLYSNRISDITPVAGLTNLTALSLSSNQISDITPVAGLTNLMVLYLGNNQIGDLTPVAGLTTLCRLSLENTGISDLSALLSLLQLRYLNLAGNPLSWEAHMVHIPQIVANNPGVEIYGLEIKATSPSPADRATRLSLLVFFQWTPSSVAVAHDLYLGPSSTLGEAHLIFDDLPASVTTIGYPVEADRTYYWRVDTIDPDGGLHEGDVWSFTTAP